ncbi:hypothetical protein GCM10011316_24960 [Roseibium aquae]|uniref:Ceramidase n=1 Tax=Roseibium aquae TaxID=1323746 RepID=A0A916TKW6_9HYPH|nr:ceramidase domain-containing protein [Roseibium aquae]GGB51970.1 hypothetical protein GCM10011316_24960 [Roseibium aquae]
MALTDHVDIYCERLTPAFWAEPVNAVTNAAFLVAAVAAYGLWRRQTPDDRAGLALIGLVFLIGIGSFLFHTFATRWAGAADVIPIMLFILFYLLMALRRFLELHWVICVSILIGFFVLGPMVGEIWVPIIGGSASYLPALLAIFVVGAFYLPKNRRLALWVLASGGVFTLSLTFRALDMPMCDQISLGTHFLWHILNAVVLFLLLRVLIWQRAGYTSAKT